MLLLLVEQVRQLLSYERDRVRYLLKAYLRARLEKVQRFAGKCCTAHQAGMGWLLATCTQRWAADAGPVTLSDRNLLALGTPLLL